MLKDGSYPAIASGYVTKFSIGNDSYEGQGVRGVRGLNLRDTVTITNGVPSSSLLGDLTKVSMLVAHPVYSRTAFV
jgi:hypothetical protein